MTNDGPWSLVNGQYIIQNHHHQLGIALDGPIFIVNIHNHHVCDNNYQGSGHIEGLAVLWEDGTEAKAAGNSLNDRY